MRRLFLNFSIFLAALWVALSVAPAFGQQTVLYYRSEPGDYIGQGQEVTLTTEDVDFIVRPSFRGSVRISMNNFTRVPRPPSIWWNAEFAPPQGTDLVVGAYENATRWPFQAPTEPGLSFSGQGRGCNRLTGRFDVLDAVYDPNTGAVISFAVDFEQHCEGGAPALFGSIRFNSLVPLPALIPPKITLLNDLNGDQCVEATGPDGATISLLGSSISEDPVDFLWTTSTGESEFGTEFSFGLGVDQSAEVTLTIEDLESRDQASSSLTVCASDTTAPQVTILSPTEGEVFVGENARLSVDVADAVDPNIDHYRVSAVNTTTVPLDVSTGTSNIQLFRKIKDGTIQVEVTVEAQDFSGNLGSSTVTVFRAHDLGMAP